MTNASITFHLSSRFHRSSSRTQAKGGATEVLVVVRQVAQEGKQETETKTGWPGRKKLGSVWEGQDEKEKKE